MMILTCDTYFGFHFDYFTKQQCCYTVTSTFYLILADELHNLGHPVVSGREDHSEHPVPEYNTDMDYSVQADSYGSKSDNSGESMFLISRGKFLISLSN